MVDAVAARSANRVPGLRAACVAATLVVGIAGAPQATALTPAPGNPTVLLSAADGGPLAGSGIALIMGPSMIPTPSQEFAETVEELYLSPHGFAGELEVLTTPAETYLLDQSLTKGAQILTDRVLELIELGEADGDHPVTVFGYSQSAALTTLAMQQLAEADVPSSAVHFVLIGNSANPNGGLMVGFENMPEVVEAMGQSYVTLGNPTPSGLYPTSIYTLEYDGYADFPRYLSNVFADLNAVMGMATQHIAYLGLTPDQIEGAILLDTDPDSLVSSYMIRSEYLPLLYPLLFVPVTGKPMYDLMEPTMRILVNLGYGSIENGWNEGSPDEPTLFTMEQPNIDWNEVNAALAVAAQTGWNAFVADILDPATYQVVDVIDNPALATLLASGASVGLSESDDVQDMLNGLTSLMWEALVGRYMNAEYWENWEPPS
ncbi:PE family protein [Mycolicibacter nonchromogenicus]|uniref:PE family protein n=1 Tax=Mycolicibacter nonchromogenicus TaxID=1782 RepID=A0A1X1ZNJ3_MYCNO|nr:PE-PPE domain-containing protein [Mycolicibacter nonchromogenicus]ORW24920.1 PE family protein [Mycolicibacter nonchromogenicus]